MIKQVNGNAAVRSSIFSCQQLFREEKKPVEGGKRPCRPSTSSIVDNKTEVTVIVDSSDYYAPSKPSSQKIEQ